MKLSMRGFDFVPFTTRLSTIFQELPFHTKILFDLVVDRWGTSVTPDKYGRHMILYNVENAGDLWE